MDLRTAYPRSVREKLAGYVHLARMIDKCRATIAGTQGEYNYPCPLDKQLLGFTGLTVEQFTEAVRGKTDDQIVQWLRGKVAPHKPAEIDAWNAGMLISGPTAPEQWDYYKKCIKAADPSRTDLTTWVDMLDLDEKRPVPKRTAAAR